MTHVADELLSELENSVRDLVDNMGEHYGECTNHYRKQQELKSIPDCTKHAEALDIRKRRVETALQQMQLLRDVFRM